MHADNTATFAEPSGVEPSKNVRVPVGVVPVGAVAEIVGVTIAVRIIPPKTDWKLTDRGIRLHCYRLQKRDGNAVGEVRIPAVAGDNGLDA